MSAYSVTGAGPVQSTSGAGVELFSPAKCRMLKFLRTRGMPNRWACRRFLFGEESPQLCPSLRTPFFLRVRIRAEWHWLANLQHSMGTENQLANSSTSRRGGLGKTLESNCLSTTSAGAAYDDFFYFRIRFQVSSENKERWTCQTNIAIYKTCVAGGICVRSPWSGLLNMTRPLQRTSTVPP